MTREEAIKGLKVLRKDFSGYKPNEEMFDMAIEALAAEPSKSCCDKAPKNYDVDKCPYQRKNCIMQCLRGEEK